MSRAMSMREVAERVGLHYDTFRRRWRALAAGTGFPRPFDGRRWDAAAVEGWIAARSGAPLEAAQAHDPSGKAALEARARRAQQALALLRSAA